MSFYDGQKMLNARLKKNAVLIGVATLCCGLILFSIATPAEAKKRKFKKKTCIECHDEFVDK